jgi:hypothetical protein
MSLVRRFWPAFVLAAFAVSLAVGVPRAAATQPFPDTGIATLDSQHFRVYYNRDNVGYPKAYISQEQAGEVLGMAERAYELYKSWGLTEPDAQALPPDSKSLIPISVDDFCTPAISYADGLIRGPGPAPVVPDPAARIDPAIPGPDQNPSGWWCRWNAMMNPGTAGFPLPAGDGEIHLDATTGLDYHTIAHDVFELYQWKADPQLMNDTLTGVDSSNAHWLQEGAAEWAAFRAEDYGTANKDSLGQNTDRSADCVGTECGSNDLDRSGYPGWVLFEYLTQRFGSNDEDSAPVVAITNGLAASASGAADMSTYLAGHSTTLENFFNDFATARLTGGFTPSTISNILPPTQASISTGLVTATLPTAYADVNHLGVRYIALQHGDPTNVRAPCYAATLALNVTIPATSDAVGAPAIPSTPYYFSAAAGATAQALTVSGTSATITVPWNTCSGSPDAYLSLPNDSWNPAYDGREFTINGTITVDLSSPASPSSPQPGLVPYGPVYAAPTTDPAPMLTVYAPEVLRVNSKTRLLRFIIFSSGSGSVDAVVGTTDLGKASLRAGDNDVRWKLPLGLVKALRKTSANNMLSLTSLSPSGTPGATYTRRVVIVPRRKH